LSLDPKSCFDSQGRPIIAGTLLPAQPFVSFRSGP
jgi:hypothetical protein